ncbi:MAG: maleylpyruvate isomerase family mycothiol-dependent enzyme [Actinobacteria bacterium]|nr:maleylpyruvate isomerase family mycothiol-dependent enzyme [Actinomycetota bacterium]
MSDDQKVVDALDEEWQSIDKLCDGLTEAEWKTETECPGWSVQDNVAHLIGIESVIMGRPPPDHTPPDLPHVKNDIGKSNEVWVDARRARPGPEVLDEFRAVARERIDTLRGMSDDDFSAESWTPAGPGTVRDLLPFRIFDSWAHEQDMRRALSKPGHLDGPAAELSLGRLTGALPFVVGKKVKPPDGATVVFDWDGNTTAITMDGGRAKPLDPAPTNPTVRLTMDTDTLVRLGMGRGDSAKMLAAGKVGFDGDEELGRRIAGEMNFLF